MYMFEIDLLNNFSGNIGQNTMYVYHFEVSSSVCKFRIAVHSIPVNASNTRVRFGSVTCSIPTNHPNVTQPH